MSTLDEITGAISRRGPRPGARALLVGISGIDGSGKGYLAGRLHARLTQAGCRVALLNVDGWLNLPFVRFARHRPGEHFYHHGLRLDEMFGRLVLPLRDLGGVRLNMAYVEETATSFREQRYEFDRVDVVLVEGIFLFKRAYRPHFDVAAWIDCTFESALERALVRGQEGLPPAETIRAYETIYFPAQRIHLERDAPRESADAVLINDPRVNARLAAPG